MQDASCRYTSEYTMVNGHTGARSVVVASPKASCSTYTNAFTPVKSHTAVNTVKRRSNAVIISRSTCENTWDQSPVGVLRMWQEVRIPSWTARSHAHTHQWKTTSMFWLWQVLPHQVSNDMSPEKCSFADKVKDALSDVWRDDKQYVLHGDSLATPQRWLPVPVW